MDSLKDSLLTQLRNAELAFLSYNEFMKLYQKQLGTSGTLRELMESSKEGHVTTGDLQVRAGAFVTGALAVIERATGCDSVYYQQAQRCVDRIDVFRGVAVASDGPILTLFGVLGALRQAIEYDFLQSARERIHGEVFTDFLDMAGYFHEMGYKDAAAVMAGGVLEQHIRQLCAAHNIATEEPHATGKTHSKTAERMNTDLAKAGAYDKGAQKRVTAWLDLRNNAAHGHYEKYELQDVGLFIQEIRLFVSQNPA